MENKNPFPNQNEKFILSSKYRGIEDNIWQTLFPDGTADVVNLGAGFPDYQPNTEIVANLAKACSPTSSHLNQQYTRAFGHVGLVKAVAKLYGKLLHREIDPMDEVLITDGAYGGLFYSIMSNVGKGDEVIIIEPAFDCYETMVKLAGGKPVCTPLQPCKDSSKNDGTSGSWKLADDFATLFNKNTKAIILNSPNNPLGKVFTRDELMFIGGLCKKYNVLIISDEVYEWIVYDKNEHIRIAGIDDFWDRTITIGSAGKSFGVTGWRLGWAYGPAHLMYNLGVAHLNCINMVHTPEQVALAETFESEIPKLGTPDSCFYKVVEILKKKRERVVEAMRTIGLEPVVPQGGYFVLVNWRALETKIDLSKETDKYDDFKFVNWLYREKKLLGIPPSAFYSEANRVLAKDYIRFNFYKKEETLDAAEKILLTLK